MLIKRCLLLVKSRALLSRVVQWAWSGAPFGLVSRVIQHVAPSPGWWRSCRVDVARLSSGNRLSSGHEARCLYSPFAGNGLARFLCMLKPNWPWSLNSADLGCWTQLTLSLFTFELGVIAAVSSGRVSGRESAWSVATYFRERSWVRVINQREIALIFGSRRDK